MKAFKIKIKDLPLLNRQHLAWRLDHSTWCGYLTAGRIARLEQWQDKSLFEVFKTFGNTDHSAKIHSHRVVNFNLSKPPVRG